MKNTRQRMTNNNNKFDTSNNPGLLSYATTVILKFELNPFPNKPWFLRVCSIGLLKTLWEKEEIACNEQFLLFPQCFLSFWRTSHHFSSNLELLSANPFSLEGSKICHLGKG